MFILLLATKKCEAFIDFHCDMGEKKDLEGLNKKNNGLGKNIQIILGSST